jgi:hypothetical protein
MPRRSFVAGTSVPLWAFALLLLLLNAPTALAAAAAPAPANTITINGALGLSQNYLPNAWQPVHFELRNDADRGIDGSVVLPLGAGDGPATMRLPVSVPPRSIVRLSVSGYFPRLVLPTSKKKDSDVPPLSVAEFRASDGTLLSRTPIMGLPLSATGGAAGDDDDDGGIILVVNQRSDVTGEEYDVESLATLLSKGTGLPLTIAGSTIDAVTREPQGLRPLKAVVLDDLDPQALDAGQRQAMMNYLRGGGVVVLSAPNALGGRPGTWLAPLLPVRIIGSREASQIASSDAGGPTLKLRSAVPIVEAIAASAAGNDEVLLRDRDYVHVAVRQVGLGKVVFTSFPINALADQQQPQVAALWGRLLSLGPTGTAAGAAAAGTTTALDQSQLAQDRKPILASMIGRKVASWRLAAALAGGYVAIIFLAQALFFGAARPRAFVVSVTAALLLSGALLAMGMARRHEQSLQEARLGVLDIAAGGGGTRHETVAYVGVDNAAMPLRAADERVMIKPVIADPHNRPSITQQPFVIDKAGVFPERIERVWEADAPLDASMRLAAVARFGADGLTLEIDNGIGQPISAPLLLSGRRAFSLADVAGGKSRVNKFQLNLRDDFTNVTMLPSDLAKRRGEVIRASITPAKLGAVTTQSDASPLLVGWLDERSVEPLISSPPDAQPADRKGMVLVRTPVRIEPSPVGAKISVPGALVNVDSGKLPYDADKAESAASQEQGEWLLGFAILRQIGIVRPNRATLEMRITSPAHSMTIRNRQCAGGSGGGSGKPIVNLNGDVLAQWKREVGLRRVAIDCGAGDFDQQGRIWLLLQVQTDSATAPTPSLTWQIKEIAMSFDAAEVIAPPRPAIADVPQSGEKE